MNAQIGDAFNQWDVDFDPYGFVERTDWAQHVNPSEDLLQVGHVYGELIIYVGCANGVYTASVVAFPNWWSPIESYETTDYTAINIQVCKWMAKYANGK